MKKRREWREGRLEVWKLKVGMLGSWEVEGGKEEAFMEEGFEEHNCAAVNKFESLKCKPVVNELRSVKVGV